MKATHIRCSIEGLNLERCLRNAAERGIIIKCISREPRKMTAFVPLRDWEMLESIAGQGGWKATKLYITGLGAALQTLKKNWFMIICILAVTVAFLAASQCVLRIETMNAGPYVHDIEDFLHEIGFQPPIRKSDCDLTRLRELLQWRYPDIAYIDCSFRGSTMVIAVHEGANGKTDIPDDNRNIVAARDGIIVSVVTTAGTPAVFPGDIVRKGDVLISAYEKDRGEKVSAVAAEGIVTARVWVNTAVTMPLTETETHYSGQTAETLNVSCPLFDLLKEAENPFQLCDITTTSMPLGGVFIPLTVRRTTYSEYSLSENRLSPQQITQSAGQAALRKLVEENGFTDDFVDKWVEYSMIDDEVVCASAFGERIVDIAVRDGLQ